MTSRRQPSSTTDSDSETRAATERRARLVRFLHAHDAGEIEHLNGSLLEHLERTEFLLRRWRCSETVALAGLCHASYGTDGFPTALITLDRRDEITRRAGTDVEALVYLYASCDRGVVYPRLRDGQKDFRDRFTGQTFRPPDGQLRDFVDLTLANEADVGVAGAGPEDEPPAWLRSLFGDLGHLASASVRDGFEKLVSLRRRGPGTDVPADA